MTTITYESIEVLRDAGVATVRLNRPDQLNAWDWQMHREMGHAFAALDGDDDVRAIVLTGAGRAFCAGAALVKSGETFDGTPPPRRVRRVAAGADQARCGAVDAGHRRGQRPGGRGRADDGDGRRHPDRGPGREARVRVQPPRCDA